MSSLEEIANKAVPTYETSKELNWQEETHWYWLTPKNWGLAGEEVQLTLGIKLPSGGFLVMLQKNEMWFEKIYRPDQFEEVVPAPTMDEIISKLPSVISSFNENMYLDLVSAPYGNRNFFFLQYTTKTNKDYFTSMRIGESYWFAEACADLYIRLRKEGLL